MTSWNQKYFCKGNLYFITDYQPGRNPDGVKAIRESVLHLVEFEAISRAVPSNDRTLSIASEALYEFN